MILIDTSVWVALYRSKSQRVGARLAEVVAGRRVVNAPFVTTEVLQGARDEAEWVALAAEMSRLPPVDLPASLWIDAARIYYDLRRSGLTVRGTIDCYLAQLCVTHNCVLLHCDKDFETIASVCSLNHQYFQIDQGLA